MNEEGANEDNNRRADLRSESAHQLGTLFRFVGAVDRHYRVHSATRVRSVRERFDRCNRNRLDWRSDPKCEITKLHILITQIPLRSYISRLNQIKTDHFVV